MTCYVLWEDEGVEHLLPACWRICNTCKGDGTHSLHLGAITAEQWERDWDYEERERYLQGGYDKICEKCGGSGKVKVVYLSRLKPEIREAYTSYLGAVARSKREEESERRFMTDPEDW